MIIKFTQPELGLAINIPEKLAKKIRTHTGKHVPKEFGGVLLGNYSDDKKTANITYVIIPSKYQNTEVSFQWDPADVHKKIEKRYVKSDGKEIYIGEWHSHPNGSVKYSGKDIKAIQDIANDSQVKIDSPMLLIFGAGTTMSKIGVYVYFKNKLYQYVQNKTP